MNNHTITLIKPTDTTEMYVASISGPTGTIHETVYPSDSLLRKNPKLVLAHDCPDNHWWLPIQDFVPLSIEGPKNFKCLHCGHLIHL